MSPVVIFVITISPGESIHVRPNIRLLTLVGGGTKSRITPSLLRDTRVLQADISVTYNLVTGTQLHATITKSYGLRAEKI